jgi:2'-5' RNA ligase
LSGDPAGTTGAPERVRLFVALELPEEVREALASWRAPVLDGVPASRAVARESLHVTLCFLGWRWTYEIPAIDEAIADVAGRGGRAARLSVVQGIWLPPRRPRVLAVELADAGRVLGGIQGELSRALQAGGWYEPESRPFLAHVTVARVGRGGRVRRDGLPPAPAVEFEGTTVTLYRSRLARGGAQYEPLARFEL